MWITLTMRRVSFQRTLRFESIPEKALAGELTLLSSLSLVSIHSSEACWSGATPARFSVHRIITKDVN